MIVSLPLPLLLLPKMGAQDHFSFTKDQCHEKSTLSSTRSCVTSKSDRLVQSLAVPSSSSLIYAEGSLIHSDKVHRYSFETPPTCLDTDEDHASRFSYPNSQRHSTFSLSTSFSSARKSFTYEHPFFLGKSLPDFETLVYCPACKKWLQSRLRYRNGSMVWLAAFILYVHWFRWTWLTLSCERCRLLCTLVLCWVPFYVKYCKGESENRGYEPYKLLITHHSCRYQTLLPDMRVWNRSTSSHSLTFLSRVMIYNSARGRCSRLVNRSSSIANSVSAYKCYPSYDG